MRKKIIKLLESILPRVYDSENNLINRTSLANKILDALPFPERLDLYPFQTWIPFVCSACTYNDAYRLGCTYELRRAEESPPKDCPLGHK